MLFFFSLQHVAVILLVVWRYSVWLMEASAHVVLVWWDVHATHAILAFTDSLFQDASVRMLHTILIENIWGVTQTRVEVWEIKK